MTDTVLERPRRGVRAEREAAAAARPDPTATIAVFMTTLERLSARRRKSATGGARGR